jgi:hypothetical protein
MKMEFKDLETIDAGEYGEKLVDQYLKDKGFKIGSFEDGPHPFDRFVCTTKNELFLLDTKTKPKRTYYDDTGIDLKDYNKYLELSDKHHLQFFLFFVDYVAKRVYYGEIHDLSVKHIDYLKEKIYPLIEKCNEKVIYFPICNFKYNFKLSDEDAEKLASYCHSNY